MWAVKVFLIITAAFVTSSEPIKIYITGDVQINVCNNDNNDKCPMDGEFFKVPGSEVCYRRFKDEERSWPEAQALCESHRLTLAEDPKDHKALGRYIIAEDGGGPGYWVGARDQFGSGTFHWQRSGNIIPDTLEGGGAPLHASRDGCLVLWTENDVAGSPYARIPCSDPKYAVCQVPVQ